MVSWIPSEQNSDDSLLAASIDLSAMSESHHENQQKVVLYGIQDSVIARSNPIAFSGDFNRIDPCGRGFSERESITRAS